MKLRKVSRLALINVMIFSILLIVTEIILSMVIDFPDGYFTYEPNSGFQFGIDPKYIEGINDTRSIVSFNSQGARSPEILGNSHHKIVAIGGSTTACFALNEKEVWTSLLANKLGKDYWVGNFGRLGNDTNHHVYQVEYLLEQKGIDDVEAVLFLIGINDFGRFLATGSSYNQMSEYASKLSGFAQMPDLELPFYRRLALFKLLRKAKQKTMSFSKNPSYGAVQNEMRHQRQAQTHEDQLPDLHEALTHYEKNIRRMIIKVKERNMRPIFMTQPTLWKDGLEKKYEQLLLMGGAYQESDPEKLMYYSTKALAAGMAMFNKVLLKVCEEEGVLCFDLAHALPKTTEVFYDDCHFNTSGAKMVAEQLYQFLDENYLKDLYP